jgi:hypothetical protein
VQRTLVGISAVVLFVVAGLMAWQGLGPREGAAICTRVGFVMSALWLAMPSSGRAINWWLVLGAVALMVGFARLPRAIKLIAVATLPFAAAWWWIRTRARRNR